MEKEMWKNVEENDSFVGVCIFLLFDGNIDRNRKYIIILFKFWQVKIIFFLIFFTFNSWDDCLYLITKRKSRINGYWMNEFSFRNFMTIFFFKYLLNNYKNISILLNIMIVFFKFFVFNFKRLIKGMII